MNTLESLNPFEDEIQDNVFSESKSELESEPILQEETKVIGQQKPNNLYLAKFNNLDVTDSDILEYVLKHINKTREDIREDMLDDEE